jgi:hypothetical protein
MGHDKYDLPRLSSGNYGLPRPVPFLFRFGDPIDLGKGLADGHDEDALHHSIWQRAQRHLDDTVTEWTSRFASGDQGGDERTERKAA